MILALQGVIGKQVVVCCLVHLCLPHDSSVS